MSRVRSWCFTINIPPTQTWTDYDYLKDIECTYLVFGYELAPSSGQPHLQGFVHFRNGKTLEAVKTALNCTHVHLEEKRGTFLQASDYCKKIPGYFEKGILPMDAAAKGAASKELYSNIVSLAENRKWDELKEQYPRVYLTQISNLQKVACMASYKPKSLEHYPGWFISGTAGTGKTRCARELIGDRPFFTHSGTKWWDGYSGESIVLIDDLTPTQSCQIAGCLKLWFDLHAFSGEVKGVTGGTGFIRPHTIIITSNYSLDALFPTTEDYRAMARRFPRKRCQESFVWSDRLVSQLKMDEEDPFHAWLDTTLGARNGASVSYSAPVAEREASAAGFRP